MPPSHSMPSRLAAEAPRWAELLGSAADKDLGSAVQGILWVIETQPSPDLLDFDGLSKAAATSLQSGQLQRMLAGSLAVLAVLDLELPPHRISALSSDALFAGLSSALASPTALLVATAARALASLVAASDKRGKQDCAHAGRARAGAHRRCA